MLLPRLIPCLDLRDGRVVKGVRFEGLREVGDPVALASRYADAGADASPGGDASAAPEALTSTADVPVGSGVIVGDVVVTQPVAGDYQAFSAVCTHSGCLINQVADGTINCPCHGSKFSLDGQVVNGPAARPLTPVSVEVQGDSIVLT